MNKRRQNREKEPFERILREIESKKAMIYGLSCNEIKLLVESLKSMKQNVLTVFPDYYDDNSIAELFQITSSKEGKKGSEEQRGKNAFVKKTMHKQMEILSQKVMDHLEEQHIWVYPKPNHSHDCLLKSLEKNLDKHLKNLEKYLEGHSPQRVVFIIEYNDAELFIEDDGGKEAHYSLSKDSKALKIIEAHQEMYDCIIYADHEMVEVINPRYAAKEFAEKISPYGERYNSAIIMNTSPIQVCVDKRFQSRYE